MDTSLLPPPPLEARLHEVSRLDGLVRSEPVAAPRATKIAAVTPPPPVLPPPPSANAVEAYLVSDDALLTPHMRRAFRGYHRGDVHASVDAMRQRIVGLRADLERAQAVQKQADEIVNDAQVAATRMLTDAQANAEELLEETQQRCQLAARRGIAASFEMAGILGYSDSRSETVDNQAEQDAFDRFFDGDTGEDSDRTWMVAS